MLLHDVMLLPAAAACFCMNRPGPARAFAAACTISGMRRTVTRVCGRQGWRERFYGQQHGCCSGARGMSNLHACKRLLGAAIPCTRTRLMYIQRYITPPLPYRPHWPQADGGGGGSLCSDVRCRCAGAQGVQPIPARARVTCGPYHTRATIHHCRRCYIATVHRT